MSKSVTAGSFCCKAAVFALCILALHDSMAAGTNESRDQAFAVRMDNGSRIFVRVCRPDTDTSAPLVVINHGSPLSSAARPGRQLGRCGQEAARWFLTRGYVVAFPLRRRYGATGGASAESYGPCNRADSFHASLETARDIDAAVQALTTLPYIRPDV